MTHEAPPEIPKPAFTPGATVVLLNGHHWTVLESYEDAKLAHREALEEDPRQMIEFTTYRDFGSAESPDHEPMRVSVSPMTVVDIQEITKTLWERHSAALIEAAREAAQRPQGIMLFPGFGG